LPAKRASAGHCGSRPRPQACYGRLGSIGYSFVRASPGLAHASPSGNSQTNRSVRLGPLGGALMARPNCPDFSSAGIVTHGRVPGGDMMLKGTGRQHAPYPPHDRSVVSSGGGPRSRQGTRHGTEPFPAFPPDANPHSRFFGSTSAVGRQAELPHRPSSGREGNVLPLATVSRRPCDPSQVSPRFL
jgi:hypothetical protein